MAVLTRMVVGYNEINSMSVMSEEIEILQMYEGDTLKCRRGKEMAIERDCVAILDRCTMRRTPFGDKINCTMVRQIVSGKEVDIHRHYLPASQTPGWLRRLLEACHERRVTVRGGIVPLSRENEIAVPAFGMSGTKWFLVPEKELRAAWERHYQGTKPFPEIRDAG